MIMDNANDLRAKLAHHTGSETLYRYPLMMRHLYTEGVHDFIENAGGGAYWLLDIIMTEPAISEGMRRESFVMIELVVEDTKARLSVRRDINDPEIFSRFIKYTDCPEGAWKFYFVDGVLMLPSEY